MSARALPIELQSKLPHTCVRCDAHAVQCSTVLGWKYEHAHEQSQKYKEGKFIVEKAMILKEGDW